MGAWFGWLVMKVYLFTGATVMLQSFPDLKIILVAIAYAIGAHGIMTLNDFKALKGDRALGINSLPVQLGPERAAKIACYVMAIPQILVITLLFAWGLIVFYFCFIAFNRTINSNETFT